MESLWDSIDKQLQEVGEIVDSTNKDIFQMTKVSDVDGKSKTDEINKCFGAVKSGVEKATTLKKHKTELENQLSLTDAQVAHLNYLREIILSHMERTDAPSAKYQAAKNELASLEKEIAGLSENRKFLAEEVKLNQLNQKKVSLKLSQITSSTKNHILGVHNQVKKQVEENIFLKIQRLEIEANCIDLCYVIDVTGSMAKYIEITSQLAQKIVNLLNRPKCQLRIGFVGYRDVTDERRFEILPFTTNVEEFTQFLMKIEADGGDDDAEDINGGLQQVLHNLDWKFNTQLIIHIADAPCHGTLFHSEKVKDNFPSGHPDDQPWDKLIKSLKDTRKNYVLFRIKNSTDQMFSKLKEMWDVSSPVPGLVFDQFDFGGDPNKFINGTLIKVATARDSTSRLATSLFEKSVANVLDEEIKAEVKEGPAHTTENLFKKIVDHLQQPDWNNPNFFQLHLETDITYAFYDPEMRIMTDPAKISVHLVPFSAGSFSNAYYCKVLPYKRGSNYYQMALKRFKSPKSESIYRLIMEKNNVANSLAREYNLALEKVGASLNERIYFNRVLFVTINNCPCIMEAFIEGNFEKYTSNSDFVNEAIPIMSAFSHFTYEITESKYMVADLQGCNTLLTDPVVHSYNLAYASLADLGIYGMLSFLRNHRCNNYCEMLKLTKSFVQADLIRDILIADTNFSMEIFYKKCRNYYCNQNAKKQIFCERCDTFKNY